MEGEKNFADRRWVSSFFLNLQPEPTKTVKTLHLSTDSVDNLDLLCYINTVRNGFLRTQTHRRRLW